MLAGWLCHAGQPRGTVVLMHGVRSNRLSMVERARFRGEGYDVLLFADVGCPVLILGGTADNRTTAEETTRLFSAAREPKSLWLVPGAAHVDLARFAPAEYRRRVPGFLEVGNSPPAFQAGAGGVPPVSARRRPQDAGR